jgi:hypothetical protein
MHSFGESSTQPSAPCSASGECGGNRSNLIESDETLLRFRPAASELREDGVFFKSAAAPLSETESIMSLEDSEVEFAASQNSEHPFAIYSQSYSPRKIPPCLMSFAAVLRF